MRYEQETHLYRCNKCRKTYKVAVEEEYDYQVAEREEASLCPKCYENGDWDLCDIYKDS